MNWKPRKEQQILYVTKAALKPRQLFIQEVNMSPEMSSPTDGLDEGADARIDKHHQKYTSFACRIFLARYAGHVSAICQVPL
jgi:hypothetical protein